MADVLYTAVATARGGRQGEVVSDDGILDLMLHTPVSLGGPEGEYTNPEQLFAAGYSACFHSALKLVAAKQKVDVEGSSITAHVNLEAADGGFGISAKLVGSFPTLDAATAMGLMETAHTVCPYSRATKGNIVVELEVS
jgi:Ohr subfamily peroxiredoxin